MREGREEGRDLNGCVVNVNNFFFQAEDGIRDTSVTGVQTCALPIWAVCFLLIVERSVTFTITEYADWLAF